MRRFWMLVLVLCLLNTPALAENSLANRAVELAAACDALAEDEAYISAMIGSGNSKMITLIESWAAGSHDQPELVVRVDTANLLKDMMALYGMDSQDEWPDITVQALNRRMTMSLPSMFNATQGAETLAASTAATSSVIFASDAQGSGLFVLLYENAVPVMAAWYAENGAVSMQATFMAQEELAACQSVEDIAAWLKEQGWELPCEAME